MLQKTLVLLLCLTVTTTVKSLGQNLTLPQEEFSIFTADSLEMEVGSFKKINVWVLRSKAFRGTRVKMDISSILPVGIVINFSPRNDYFDVCEAAVSVNPVTKPGVYYVIISGTMSYKSKGHILKLIVVDADKQLSLTGD